MRAVLPWVCGLMVAVATVANASQAAAGAKPPIVAPVHGTVSATAINACGAEAFGQTRRNPVTGRMQICRPVAR